MPWHFGGDERLSWDEIDAYIDDLQERAHARKTK